MTVMTIILVMVAGVLLVAWIDGGREDLRQITHPVDMPDLVELERAS